MKSKTELMQFILHHVFGCSCGNYPVDNYSKLMTSFVAADLPRCIHDL